MQILKSIFYRRIISVIALLIAGIVMVIPTSFANAQVKTLPFFSPIDLVVSPQQLINNEAKYFTDGTLLTVEGSLNGNISSNPNKRYTLFIVNYQGTPTVVHAYLGNLYVDASNPNVTIQIYTTSWSIEKEIMSGIAGEGNNGFASISGIVNKSLSQGGAYYYVFNVTNVVLQPR